MLTCEICELPNPTFHFLFSKSDRQFHRCNSCGTVKQHPTPTPEELKQFYDESYKQGMYADFAAADELKLATARRRLKEIKKVFPLEGTWLDVGCSNGAFVRIANEAGLTARGIDISQEAIRIAKSQGLPVESGDIHSLDSRTTFDCITAFDVIEHLPDPATFIRAARDLLKPGGTLVLTTPNLNSVSRYLMRRRWYFYIPFEHLYLFNAKALCRLVSKEKLGIVYSGRTYKPMTYDYAELQFKEFNPGIGVSMSIFRHVIPKTLRSMAVPLSIGEQLLIAARPSS